MAKKKSKSRPKKTTLPPFDKYAYYRRSVQSPDVDAEFLAKVFKDLTGKKCRVMREDFCAAAALCCEWVKLDKSHQAIGVDLDPEPLAYGRQNYVPTLSDEQQKRLQLMQRNVMDRKLPKADIVSAMNFSYFGFKKRQDLKAYFENVYRTLNDTGVLVLDCFGGPDCMEANEHETEHKDFSYFWDQESYNPLSHEAMFYIHFKRKGEKRREKVFTYDWRLWTIAELKDLLEEAGFKKSLVYWEGTDKDGEGDGIFSPSEAGEECDAWVAYVIAKK